MTRQKERRKQCLHNEKKKRLSDGKKQEQKARGWNEAVVGRRPFTKKREDPS